MISIPAKSIMNAWGGGEIGAIVDGTIRLLTDLHPVLSLPQTPAPQISKSYDNSVVVSSGDVPVARIDAESAEDADEIAGWLADLLAIAG